jgi:hypothetical protein
MKRMENIDEVMFGNGPKPMLSNTVVEMNELPMEHHNKGKRGVLHRKFNLRFENLGVTLKSRYFFIEKRGI